MKGHEEVICINPNHANPPDERFSDGATCLVSPIKITITNNDNNEVMLASKPENQRSGVFIRPRKCKRIRIIKYPPPKIRLTGYCTKAVSTFPTVNWRIMPVINKPIPIVHPSAYLHVLFHILSYISYSLPTDYLPSLLPTTSGRLFSEILLSVHVRQEYPNRYISALFLLLKYPA